MNAFQYEVWSSGFLKPVKIAQCVHVIDAIKMMSDGRVIRNGNTIVWHEGKESFSALEMPDRAAKLIYERINGQ